MGETEWIETGVGRLPVIEVWRDCYEISADCWRGIDSRGVAIEMHGGHLPPDYTVALNSDGAAIGAVRLIPRAEAPARRKRRRHLPARARPR